MMYPSLAAAQRLSSGWHDATTGLEIQPIDANDVLAISKHVNLTSLRLGNSFESPVDSADVLAAVSPALRRLVELAVVGGAPWGGCLQVIARDAGLRTRLAKLELLSNADAARPLLDAELYALAALSSLRHLAINCSAVSCSPAALRSACSALARLEQLQLVTSGDAPEELAASTAAAPLLPGGLQGLGSLGLYHVSTSSPSAGGREAPGTSRARQQLLAASVAGLTGLRSLCTNLPLLDAAPQLAVLSHLSGLTRLQLDGARTYHQFELLPRLPLLLELSLATGYSVPAGDLFEHPRLVALRGALSQPVAGWGGRVAERCQLQRLELGRSAVVLPDGRHWHWDDAQLAGLPLLPRLRSLATSRRLRPAGQPPGFPQLQRLLERQAPGLLELSVDVGGEPCAQRLLPRQLPVCRRLGWRGHVGSSGLLQQLADCELLLLQELSVEFCAPAGSRGMLAMVAPEQLQWLARCRGLQRVRLLRCCGAKELQARLEAMLRAAGLDAEVAVS